MTSLTNSSTKPLRVCRVCGFEAWTEEDLEKLVKDKNLPYGRKKLEYVVYVKLRSRFQNFIRTHRKDHLGLIIFALNAEMNIIEPFITREKLRRFYNTSTD